MRRLLAGSTALWLALSVGGCASILGDFEQGTADVDGSTDGSVANADGNGANGDDGASGSNDASNESTSSGDDGGSETSTGDDGGSSDGGHDADAAPTCGALGQSCCASATCEDVTLNCINNECHLASTGDLGKPCSLDGECQSGVCLGVGQPLGTDAGFTGSVCTSSCSQHDGGAPDAGDAGADAGDGGFFLACIGGWTCTSGGGLPVPICKCQYATETCNGKDDDCDGVIDNGDPGAGPCQTGLKGLCAAGAGNCTGGKIVCTQTVFSTPEICNGLDEDCNGVADNGNPGGNVSCSTGKFGVCAAGTTACQSGNVGCVQNSGPAAEVCDGLDNNCNNSTDEGTVGNACSTGLKGVCAAGTTTCNNGVGGCQQTTQSSSEICDGLDNNCNNATDEGMVGNACSTGKLGVCAAGTSTCANGVGGCAQTKQSSAEICDGLDNNCNGTVDDGMTGNACGTGLKGVCAAGTSTCVNGTAGCHQTTQSSGETCDGLDNNCDGTADEGVKTTFYRDADGDGYGTAATTTQACSAPAGYVANSTDCNDGNASVHPGASEVCNGVDDNCVGGVDEGVTSTYYRDADGDGYGNGGNTTQACSTPGGYVTNASDCDDGNASINPGAAETCNGVDDNCASGVDEGNPGGGAGCSTGLSGVCAAGTTYCGSGAIQCSQNQGASAGFHTTAGNNGSWDWNCDGNITEQYASNTYWPYNASNSCFQGSTYKTICGFYSTGSCSPTWSGWQTYACSANSTHCGETVYRYRCNYDSVNDVCAYTSDTATSEGASTGHYIYIQHEGCY